MTRKVFCSAIVDNLTCPQAMNCLEDTVKFKVSAGEVTKDDFCTYKKKPFVYRDSCDRNRVCWGDADCYYSPGSKPLKVTLQFICGVNARGQCPPSTTACVQGLVSEEDEKKNEGGFLRIVNTSPKVLDYMYKKEPTTGFGYPLVRKPTEDQKDEPEEEGTQAVQ